MALSEVSPEEGGKAMAVCLCETRSRKKHFQETTIKQENLCSISGDPQKERMSCGCGL